MAKKGQKPSTNNTGPAKWEQGLVQAQLQEVKEKKKIIFLLTLENRLCFY